MITIRKAIEKDCSFFYFLREIYFSHVNFDEHINYYMKNYKNNFYVILKKGLSIGYVRLDENKIISISFFPWERNKGYGTLALSFLIHRYDGLKARIKKDNLISQKLFSKFPEITVELIE